MDRARKEKLLISQRGEKKKKETLPANFRLCVESEGGKHSQAGGGREERSDVLEKEEPLEEKKKKKLLHRAFLCSGRSRGERERTPPKKDIDGKQDPSKSKSAKTIFVGGGKGSLVERKKNGGGIKDTSCFAGDTTIKVRT